MLVTKSIDFHGMEKKYYDHEMMTELYWNSCLISKMFALTSQLKKKKLCFWHVVHAAKKRGDILAKFVHYTKTTTEGSVE